MSQIREWANSQGYNLPARGRLPKVVVVDYLMSHPAEARVFLIEHGVEVGKRGRISVAKVTKAVNA